MAVKRCTGVFGDQTPRRSHKWNWRVDHPYCLHCMMPRSEAYESPASKAKKAKGKK